MDNWKKRFHKKFVEHYLGDGDDIYNFYGYGEDAPQMGSGKEEVDKVISFIATEIRKAKKEGRRELALELKGAMEGEEWAEDAAVQADFV